MASPRVLVLENQGFTRNVIVRMLQDLGVRDVLQAGDTEQAMVQLHLHGGVDIVFCDLLGHGMDCQAFLPRASQSGMAHSVALCGELPPEFQRTLDKMATLSGLHLLGVMSHPIQLRSLRRMLHRYQLTHAVLLPALPIHELPSENEVRRALALGEFRGWFQPQVHLRERRVIAAEVLVRWEHPARGVLLPCDFLGAVLAYDLIDVMFKQLLEQGLGMLGILRSKGLYLQLAYNLHASQLVGNGLIDYITDALYRHGFKGSTLMFELAENGLLDCTPGTQENLLRLRLLGCGLSIDDFGVGFSSMKWLCQLPFNQIKLDGKFVQRLNRPSDCTMVAITQALVRTLGMSLVVEGVSNPRIRNRLMELGCDIGQGFYLARPMSGHDLLQWLDKPDFAR